MNTNRSSQERRIPTLGENREEIAYFGYRQVPAQEKIKFVLHHFNSIASKYDFMNTLLSFGFHYLWKKKAIRVLELKPGDQVIDVCGGTGDLSILAARAVGLQGRIILYDINRPMMEGGQAKAAKAGLSGAILFSQGNAEVISFPKGIFDAAMVGFGIRNLTHMEKGLEEMHRVLKPGGKFMCLEFSRPTSYLFHRLYDFYSFQIIPVLGKIFAGTREAYTYLPESIRLFPTQKEFSDILKKIGFKEVNYKNLTNGVATIHTAKKLKEPLPHF